MVGGSVLGGVGGLESIWNFTNIKYYLKQAHTIENNEVIIF